MIVRLPHALAAMLVACGSPVPGAPPSSGDAGPTDLYFVGDRPGIEPEAVISDLSCDEPVPRCDSVPDVWVDRAEPQSELSDGSPAHPFANLTQIGDACLDGCNLNMTSGRYPARATLDGVMLLSLGCVDLDGSWERTLGVWTQTGGRAEFIVESGDDDPPESAFSSWTSLRVRSVEVRDIGSGASAIGGMLAILDSEIRAADGNAASVRTSHGAIVCDSVLESMNAPALSLTRAASDVIVGRTELLGHRAIAMSGNASRVEVRDCLLRSDWSTVLISDNASSLLISNSVMESESALFTTWGGVGFARVENSDLTTCFVLRRPDDGHRYTTLHLVGSSVERTCDTDT